MFDNNEVKIQFIENYMLSLKRCLEALPLDQVTMLMTKLENAYQHHQHIFIIGNGGSAATASHMACDLNKCIGSNTGGNSRGRFQVISLTENVPRVTALANDLGYEYIFSEQLKNLCQPGDLLIAISASGNSPNILEAVRVAKEIGANVFGILGFGGGKAREIVDDYILLPSDQYGFVEDMHMIIEHLVTAYLKEKGYLKEFYNP
jgi:D-sedoheptulose 7-phosphate isomerase